MRDILFKGKRIDNGEWVEGYLYIRNDGVYEIGYYNKEVNIERYTHEVIPETVSEYAGREDIHGNKIFENHIVKRIAFGKGYNRRVVFQEGAFGTVMEQDGEEYFTAFSTRCICEVVGNVFDNPELLEVEE